MSAIHERFEEAIRASDDPLLILPRADARIILDDLQMAIGALADIGFSTDMTMLLAKIKARRVYAEVMQDQDQKKGK